MIEADAARPNHRATESFMHTRGDPVWLSLGCAASCNVFSLRGQSETGSGPLFHRSTQGSTRFSDDEAAAHSPFKLHDLRQLQTPLP